MPSSDRALSARLDAKRRRALVRELQAWLREEREEEVGELAAGFLLDFVLDLAGPDLYNAALADAARVFREHAGIVEADLSSLTQEVSQPREADG